MTFNVWEVDAYLHVQVGNVVLQAKLAALMLSALHIEVGLLTFVDEHCNAKLLTS